MANKTRNPKPYDVEHLIDDEHEWARHVLAEYNRRFNPELKEVKPGEILFREQKMFKEDRAKRKAALCSRRAGKTTVAADGLIEAAIRHPNKDAKAVYCGLSAQSSKRIIWNMLIDLLERYQIEHDTKEHISTIYLRDYKSEIFLTGADQKDLIKRLRGVKYSIAVIDEAQGFRPTLLNDLVYDVIDAGLADLDAPMWVMGTPGKVLTGDWFRMSSGEVKGFNVHNWNLLKNPHIDGRRIIDDLLERNGWEWSNPTVQREYLGQWIHDPDKLLFRFNQYKNIVHETPCIDPETYVIAIDYGWNDQTAFVVFKFSHKHPKAYVKTSYARSKLTVSEIARKTQALLDEFPYAKIVADTGGLGKSITEELKKRYGLNIEPAQKTEKQTAIAILNDSFEHQKLMIDRSNTDLIHQLNSIEKNEYGIEEQNQQCDLADALIYGFRECMQYIYTEEKPTPHIDSDEYMAEIEEKEAEELLKKQQEGDDWWDE